MEKINLTFDKQAELGLIGKHVSEFEPITTAVKANTIICIDGKPAIVFGKFETPHPEVKAFLPTLHYTKNDRLTRRANDYETLKSADLQFGYKPQRPVFNLPASACTFNAKYTNMYGHMQKLGAEMMALYEKHSQEKYNHQLELMRPVNQRWQIPQTFFSQGIINDTANLNYHFDRGNIKGCWSCMAVFRRDCRGGNLVVPALNIKLMIEDETFVLFDGQSLLHGVTPIVESSKYGRRFSIVFYAHEEMKNCGSYEDEIKKMRASDMNKHRKVRAP